MARQARADAETLSPDVLDLRAFCLVADLGSVTAAAKTLGETKGSVSRRLTRLEREVGVVLLRRSPRLVQVTEDGQAYRQRVGRVLELLDDATLQARGARAAPSGHLRVTAPTDLALTVLAPVVNGFVERFPGVTVEMLLTATLLDFDAHQVDLALRAGSALQDSALVAHKLEDLEGALFASPAYLRAHGPVREPGELAKHRLLLAHATRGAAVLALKHRGDDARVEVRARASVSGSDYAFTREAALAGGGVAMLPTLVARGDLEAGRLVRVLPEYTGFGGALYLVHHGARFLPPKVRAFRDYVLESFPGRKKRARPA